MLRCMIERQREGSAKAVICEMLDEREDS